MFINSLKETQKRLCKPIIYDILILGLKKGVKIWYNKWIILKDVQNLYAAKI